MNEKIVVRRAAAKDAGAVIDLITALAEFEKLEPPDAAARERCVAEMQRERPRFETFLVEDDGKAAGCAIVYETWGSFNAMPKLYLEDIIVLPEYRGRGVGKALFQAIIGEAELRGCGMMEWTALDWNTPAHQFYKKMGARHLEAWQVYRLDLTAR
ncbi:GNAT family N-acetyltransferase [Dehalogenimonas sp. THU2]|uniref:GNAT family N-acetyltransferase n=1 Tax=Dehalogenimonas sp. THU2 TaxID=3151121 RepID=UPI0032181AC7